MDCGIEASSKDEGNQSRRDRTKVEARYEVPGNDTKKMLRPVSVRDDRKI